MKRIIFLSLMLLCTLTAIHASNDKVGFSASAPDVVAVGDQFRLSYTVTTKKVRDFRAPSISGFDVLMGPSRSEQSSTQIINGKMSSTSSITFTYILSAEKEGNFSIPSASITANGKKLLSNRLNIKVLPADKGNTSAKGQKAKSSSEKISSKDLFIRASVSKTSVYEQEALLLTYKIYSTVNLRNFGNVKLPDFKGFHSQEVDMRNTAHWSMDRYKGRNYNTLVYRQFVLFPQRTGKLKIGSARFDASVAKSVQSVDPFDAFFNGGSSYVNVKKTLITPEVTINVKRLPTKPANYYGGVGSFKVSSMITERQVAANKAITLIFKVSGTGNLKLISNPEFKFPASFEVYDPKVQSDTKITREGLKGSKTIEYLVIPREQGEYTIPSVSFAYFDTKSKRYKTLKTADFAIKVSPGKAGEGSTVVSNYTDKETLKVLNKDIRFIKLGKFTLSNRNSIFFGSTAYLMWYIIPLLLLVAYLVFMYSQNQSNKDTARNKTKKANKVATKRLKIAGKLLQSNEKDKFYDEVLSTLWGYISDKLSIPVANLTKDNIEEELVNYGVDKVLIDEFIGALNECEFARYAPGDENQAMDKVYSKALDVISKMEGSIKH